MQFWILFSISALFAICGAKYGYAALGTDQGAGTGALGVFSLNIGISICFILLAISFGIWAYFSK